MNNKNKIIKNHDLFRSEPLGNVPNKKIQYSIIKQTNIGDDAIVRTTNTSLEKGTVVGVNLRGLYLYLLSGKYDFSKWCNVLKIIKNNNDAIQDNNR